MKKTHLLLVIVERRNALLVLDVPHLDQPITRRRRKLHSPRQKVHPQDRVAVSLERLDASEILQTPQLDGPVSRSGGDALVDGGELDAPDTTLVAFEGTEKGEGGRGGGVFGRGGVGDGEEFGGAVLRAGSEELVVRGDVEGVDVLVVDLGCREGAERGRSVAGGGGGGGGEEGGEVPDLGGAVLRGGDEEVAVSLRDGDRSNRLDVTFCSSDAGPNRVFSLVSWQSLPYSRRVVLRATCENLTVC
jgi:hypothetical protein